MNRHEKYFNILEKVAQALEPVANARVAAFLVYKRDVIAVGYNKDKTHPFQKRHSKNNLALYLHAETDCINNALRYYSDEEVSKSSLYILRVKHSDDDHIAFIRGLAKPCEGCQKCIKRYGIKKVYYSTEEGYDIL